MCNVWHIEYSVCVCFPPPLPVYRSMVDLDRDGRINKTEFSKAMGLMQKARQQERPSLFQSQPSSGFFSTPQSSHQVGGSMEKGYCIFSDISASTYIASIFQGA